MSDLALGDLRARASLQEADTIVGIACSPKVALRIRRAMREYGTEIPILLDPRMNYLGCHCYYDRQGWSDRCDEQAAWDAE